MLTEDILKHPTRVLSESQRERFFEEGCAVVEGVADARWLERLRAAMAEMVEASRQVAASDERFILEEGHGPEDPRLRRLTSPVSHHETFWDFAAESASADVAADLCGPDVKFYHSKLNFKWPKGGQRFDWHQDIPTWPHTDYSPVTVGIYLEDCSEEQGPLLAIRGSHKAPLHSMYDKQGNWALKIPEEELPAGWKDEVVSLTGPAGSAVLINCRVIHGSAANTSARMRPMLLNVYSSADSMPYVANPIPSPYEGRIVRGRPARFSCHDPRGCELPPDWSKGYVGPWAFQKPGEAAHS
ncbi:MAG: phytanoyl-CoA dioxygenase family protein [Tistlia sp.]|uniref:phytanoyl-CoA dioxygenase family protein n=1 Tax=Tistlia sp. TaxID=3057121 RepID=UPI0034A1DF6C